MVNSCTKFEVISFTCSKDTRDEAELTKGDDLGWLGLTGRR